MRYHGVFANFPLPNYEGGNEKDADYKKSDHVGALPGM
jgi:hypothetical protein